MGEVDCCKNVWYSYFLRLVAVFNLYIDFTFIFRDDFAFSAYVYKHDFYHTKNKKPGNINDSSLLDMLFGIKK